ncbi:ABC transporter substrate-binding protein [Rhodobacter sp. Har01]|uniref:ABC transporter substrate-binding protein n=1 Tax=Rhodobacter sp. Har01 TaxID=2883999 RepID=UPI001D09038F|nr:ABC transporter substrate-binding protein [Rhodobacter sp. Har01]MCB6178981.1 ABC transporter substrate-binding protein [Rhodobacter sp. Har01]
MNRLLTLAVLALSTALPAWAEVTLTDLKGREVTLPETPDRVLLGFYYEDFIAITGPGGIDKVVAISRGPWAEWRPMQWEAYKAVFPQIDSLPDVGDTETSTFSVEAAIAAKPDVALLAAWQFDALGEGVAQLESAGIPVVVVDYNAQTLAAHLASTRVIGTLMGSEDRAERLATLYEAMITDTAARVAAAGDAPKKVYVELAKKGPAEIGNTYGNGMWAGVIDLVGGANIAKGQIENWGPLAPEYVLAEQPEVILLAGSEWMSAPEAVRVGFKADAADAQAKMAAYLTRPGWADLPAVKSGEVHAIYHGGARSLSDFVFARYLGKVLHPAAFADVDPQAELAAYYAEWLPIPLDGIFVQKLQ